MTRALLGLMAAADLDGDGRPDPAMANYGDGTVTVLVTGTAGGRPTTCERRRPP